jgi:hypothetical protein
MRRGWLLVAAIVAVARGAKQKHKTNATDRMRFRIGHELDTSECPFGVVNQTGTLECAFSGLLDSKAGEFIEHNFLAPLRGHQVFVLLVFLFGSY